VTFEEVIDGTLVVGKVQEREKAFETYDTAIEAGHGGFLLDEERPDVGRRALPSGCRAPEYWQVLRGTGH
jgi:hypothetical protein